MAPERLKMLPHGTQARVTGVYNIVLKKNRAVYVNHFNDRLCREMRQRYRVSRLARMKPTRRCKELLVAGVFRGRFCGGMDQS